MLITRKRMEDLYSCILNKMNLHFNIETQYKLIKIKKILEEEINIYNQQLASLSNYCETNENGELIFTEDGGIKIQEKYQDECIKIVKELDTFQVTIPDIYFSLEELEPLNLTLGEFDILSPFIK